MTTRITMLTMLLTLSTTFQSFSQNAIKGKITDREGIPKSGVEITIENTFGKCVSNNDGNYCISGLSSGTYLVTSYLQGFEKQVAEISITNQDGIVNFSLLPSAVTMEEIQVSAVRSNDKTPTTYTNLDAKQIQ